MPKCGFCVFRAVVDTLVRQLVPLQVAGVTFGSARPAFPILKRSGKTHGAKMKTPLTLTPTHV
jgi:hypothetical protein